MKTRAGHLHVNLKADLGSQHSPQEHPLRSHNRPGPGRLCRRERREAASRAAVDPDADLATSREDTVAEQATVDDETAIAVENANSIETNLELPEIEDAANSTISHSSPLPTEEAAEESFSVENTVPLLPLHEYAMQKLGLLGNMTNLLLIILAIESVMNSAVTTC